MSRDVIAVSPELPLDAAWRIMCRERIRHLPVVHAGALVGMLSDRDVLLRGVRGRAGAIEVPGAILVGDAMTPLPVTTCAPSTDVSDLAQMMADRKIDAIPVVKEGRLVGLVTSTDLILLLVQRDEARPLPFEFRVIEDPRAYA
jgi:acetoin utilization protein AcuB